MTHISMCQPPPGRFAHAIQNGCSHFWATLCYDEWPMITRKPWLPVSAWTLLVCFTAATAGAGADICGRPPAGHVDIVHGDRRVGQFAVTLAETMQTRRLGLMHCPLLERGTGMLFTYPDARKRVFWMKDTLIELAIVFIDAEGRVAAIAHGEPGSLSYIHSPGRIARVLEINWAEGGVLAAGDRVSRVVENPDQPPTIRNEP
jgi:uncharacterized protein